MHGSHNATGQGVFRGAQSVAAVRAGQQATESHDDRSQPDEANQRFVLQPDTPGTATEFIAQRYKDVPGPASVNSRLGHWGRPHCIHPLFRVQRRHGFAGARHRHLAAKGLIIGSCLRLRALERNLVVTDPGCFSLGDPLIGCQPER